jgi:hypothetical protein
MDEVHAAADIIVRVTSTFDIQDSSICCSVGLMVNIRLRRNDPIQL